MNSAISGQLTATSQHRTNSIRYGRTHDDELISAAQVGDEDAFVELCKRHLPLMKKKIFSIVRSPEDTEDILQETVMRAYMHMASFRRSCKFSTWITSIGINSALMLLRKRRIRKETQTGLCDEGAMEMWEPVDLASGPDILYQKKQTALLVRGELERLRPSLRSIVDLYYRTEQPVEDLAEQLDISLGAAKSRLMRGRTVLRSRLSRYGNSSACF